MTLFQAALLCLAVVGAGVLLAEAVGSIRRRIRHARVRRLLRQGEWERDAFLRALNKRTQDGTRG